jgi:hypothetical protein
VLVGAALLGAAEAGHAAHERSALLEAALATVTNQELQGHVAVLADDSLEGREAGSRGGRAAAHYIEGQLKKAGLAPAGDKGGYAQRFDPGYQNLVAKLAGVDPQLKNEFVLVGAHYDHIGYGTWRNSNGPVGYIHNGADDNASGVSTLLELIDALARTQWQPRRTIVFAFWDGEEINLLGSRYWVRQPTVPLAQVKLALNIDMIGRLRNGRLEVGGTRTAPGLRQLLSSDHLPADMRLDFTWEYKENSDHWPLFEAGVPSLIVHTGLHDDYHTPRDDVEKINVPGMHEGAAYLLETICQLADAAELPAFRAAARGENPDVQKVREAPLPPTPTRLGITWARGEGVPADRLQIDRVVDGSAAAVAGLAVGDLIAAVDGAPLNDPALLPATVLRAEKEVTLTIVRGGETKEVVCALGGSPIELGVSWREDDAEPKVVYLTRVIPYSPAARAGLAVHDRIYALEGEPFADGDALLKRVRELLDAGPDSLDLEVETDGHVRTVTVDLRLPADQDDHSL